MIQALQLVEFALRLLWIALLARAVLSFVFAFARDWRPKGFAALLVESVFTATDWLVKPLRRLIPPVTIGQIRLDVAFLAAFFAVFVATTLVTVAIAAAS